MIEQKPVRPAPTTLCGTKIQLTHMANGQRAAKIVRYSRTMTDG